MNTCVKTLVVVWTCNLSATWSVRLRLFAIVRLAFIKTIAICIPTPHTTFHLHGARPSLKHKTRWTMHLLLAFLETAKMTNILVKARTRTSAGSFDNLAAL